MDAVRTLKANLKLENKPCGWCQIGLKLGEDAAVCTACEKEHHQRCWDGKTGCSVLACANAPLRQLAPAASPAAAAGGPTFAPGLMACPACRSAIPTGSMICGLCKAITSPDGIYHGPKTNAKDAVQALTFGIIGLFICGVIFGPIAISKANSAKQQIRSDPTLGGEGMATAGLVMGIIDLIAWAIIVMARVGR
jgi:hypothetical protein